MRLFSKLLLFVILLFSFKLYAAESSHIPILCYHNFNPTKPGSMNLAPQKFEAQIKWLKDNGFTIIPLLDVVAYLKGTKNTLPAKPIVITIDDGWKSVYTYIKPLVQKYNFPVTLFIYPQSISQNKNCMTWQELNELQKSGHFNIQCHTYSHPNFKQLRRKLSALQFEQLVKKELGLSKKLLEDKLNTQITLLAWPFGIYDAFLENKAKEAGYEMAFTIDYRAAKRQDRPMAQPRFMIIDAQNMKTFMGIANSSHNSGEKTLVRATIAK